MISKVMVIAALLLMCASASHAHLRNYLVTYPYWTTPQGLFEVELYNDVNNTDSGETVLVNQTELEYGVTDRLVLGAYAVTEKKGSAEPEYAKTKLRAQYRLAEYRRLPVDPGIYLEYQWGANGRADKIEAKLLLSRDFGKNSEYNVSLNGIVEKSRKAGSEWESGYALGVSKDLNIRTTAGFELKSMEGKSYAIPGLYVTIGKNKRLNVGTAFGLTEKSDDFQLKTILEIEMF